MLLNALLGLAWASGDDDHDDHHAWWAGYMFEEEGTYQLSLTKNSSMYYSEDEFTIIIMNLNGVDWHDIEEGSGTLEEAAENNGAENTINFGGSLSKGTLTSATTTDAVKNKVTVTTDTFSTVVFLEIPDGETGDYVFLIEPEPANAESEEHPLIKSPDGHMIELEFGGHGDEHDDDEDEELTDGEVWAASFAGTFVGMLASVLGALVIIFLKDFKMVEQPLLFFSSGIIIAVSVLHLLGESGELNDYGWPHNSELATCLMGGLFVGFAVELLMNYFCGVGHSHGKHIPDKRTSIQNTIDLTNDEQLSKTNDVEMMKTNAQTEAGEDTEGGLSLGGPRLSRRQSMLLVHSERNHEAISWTVLIADAIHNFFDGFIIAEAFDNCGTSKGWTLAIAILVHELPQEMSDFYVLLKGGWGPMKAIIANFAVSCSAFLGVFIYMGLKEDLQKHGVSFFLAFSTGCFLFIGIDVVSHISPDAHQHHPAVLFVTFWLGWLVIYLLMEWHPYCAVLNADGTDPHAGHNH